MPARLTNEEVDKRLIGRFIERTEDYINNRIKMWWKCIKPNVNHKNWLAKFNDIIDNESGCPECYGNAPLTNEIIDQRLEGRNVWRLDDCNGAMYKIRWKCKIPNCNNIWPATPNDILNGETNCPECNGTLLLTNEIIDERLKDRKVIRVGNYINAKTNIWWGCKKNHKNWLAKPYNVVNNESGCTECNTKSKNENLIAEIFDSYGVNYSRNYNIKNIDSTATRNLTIDFYLHDFNIGQEYDGRQHKELVFWSSSMTKEEAEFNLKDQQERDQYKDQICKDKIILIRIDGRKYKNKKLKEYIENYIETVLKLKKTI